MNDSGTSWIHIVGSGGLGRDFLACFRNELKISGFWDDHLQKGSDINGVPVLGTLKDLLGYRENISLVIATGNPFVRKNIHELLKVSEHHFPVVIHSTAHLFDKSLIHLGPGCVIFPGVHITTDVSIGSNTIIHTNCSLHHDTVIGSHSVIMPGAVLAGNVRIGDEAYVAPNRSLTNGTIVQNKERFE